MLNANDNFQIRKWDIIQYIEFLYTVKNAKSSI